MPQKANKKVKEHSREKKPIDSTPVFEKLLKRSSRDHYYSLRLYITGTTARSTRAVANIRKLCEEFLHGRYSLEVVDIYQQPVQAMNAQIIAAPTLIKQLPKPLRRLIGNLSDREKVLIGLNLKEAA